MRGSQHPRISLVPASVASAGQEAIDVYELTGGRLDPWQRLVLREAMGERADHRWAAFEVGLVVARQNGKDEILCARELWGLFVGGERTIVHALSLDTPLPTPTGWTTMGEVRRGDWLLAPDGTPTRVMDLSGVFLGSDCYRVGFGDGTSVVASGDHLWVTEARRAPRRGLAVRTTREIAQTLTWKNHRRVQNNHRIRVTVPTAAYRAIVSCDQVASVPTKCVAVDNPAHMFLCGDAMVPTHNSAHKFDTAMEHMDRLFSLIDEVPEFRRRLAPRQPNRAHGKEGIRLKSGARIRFRARTRSGGGRGYTGDCVIFNEAMELPDEIVGSIMPILSARSTQTPGPQIWLAGSAVDQETMQNGMVLARVREAGVNATNDRLAYFEWSAEDGADPADWQARAQANPSLGLRISAEHVETEFQSPSMSVRQFMVERMGIGDWPDTSEDAGRILTREEWQQVAEHDPANRATGVPVFAVDANPLATWSSVAVAGKRADGLFNGAVLAHRPDTDWIVALLQELKVEHPKMRVVVHKHGPLSSHIDDLKAAKLRVIEANSEDYSRACVGFVAGVRERRFRYPFPQPELDEALKSARKKETAEAIRWTRADAEGADISPLVAVTLAYWGAEQARPKVQLINLNDV